tara:strand:+ start:37 stop:507 length:471 start_codon:yes stop_codon:yes gene_type:complete
MSRPTRYISYKRVHEVYDYDEVNGGLIIKLMPTLADKKRDPLRYRRVLMDGIMYKVHRVVYLYHNPDMDQSLEIDHINGNRQDNRIENLRLVTHRENMRNRVNNTVGFNYLKSGKGWSAFINVDHKNIRLGCYDNMLDARAAHLRAKKKYHIIEER